MQKIVEELLRRFFKPDDANSGTTLTQEELVSLYSRTEVIYSLIYLAMAVVCVALWLGVLMTIAYCVQSVLPQTSFKYGHGMVIWLLPSILLGAISPSIPYEILLRRKVGADRFHEYQAYEHNKYGIDGKRAGAVLVPSICLACAAAVLLSLNHYVYFTHERIAVSGFFNIGTRYYELNSLKSIKYSALYISPTGKKFPNRDYVLEFRSGDKWTTKNGPTSLEGADKAHLFSYVSQQSGVPITTVSFLTSEDF